MGANAGKLMGSDRDVFPTPFASRSFVRLPSQSNHYDGGHIGTRCADIQGYTLGRIGATAESAGQKRENIFVNIGTALVGDLQGPRAARFSWSVVRTKRG